MVAAQQQQLPADRAARLAALLRRQQQAVPQELLPEEQALDPEAEDRRARRRTCFPATIRGPGAQAELLRILQKQGVRDLARDGAVHRDGARQEAPPARRRPTTADGGRRRIGRTPNGAGQAAKRRSAQDAPRRARDADLPRRHLHRPHGPAVQPHRRRAARLSVLERRTIRSGTPYDDTGWTFGELFNVQAVRVTDAKVLDAPMETVTGDVTRAGRRHRHRHASSSINHNADNALVTLRYRSRTRRSTRPRSRSKPAGKKFNRGSFIITERRRGRHRRRPRPSSACRSSRSPAAPIGQDASAARARASRCMHTWLNTQNEGWWRQALDQLQVPFTYISTQDVAKDAEPEREVRRDPLPAGRPRHRQAIVNGMPMCGNPLPWKKTRADAEPRHRSTRPTTCGPASAGGASRTCRSSCARAACSSPSTTPPTSPCTTASRRASRLRRAQRLRIVGSVVRSKTVDATSPIAYGYDDNLVDLLRQRADLQRVATCVGGRGGRRLGPDDGGNRPTGRGTPDDPDMPQGAARRRGCRRSRGSSRGRPRRSPTSSCATASTSSRRRSGRAWSCATPTRAICSCRACSRAAARSRSTPTVVDVPSTKATSSLFSNNPIWRGETQGSYFLVFNAMLNFDQLDAGRKLDAR